MAEANKHPVDMVEWIDRDLLTPNDYNPNTQATPQQALLRISILEDGWTQPIVAYRGEDGEAVIVDGEHRWRASGDAKVRKLTNGKVPVVWLVADENHRIMSTVRHNRARGKHIVVPMEELVVRLIEQGVPKDEIMARLQMEGEEVDRLSGGVTMPNVGSEAVSPAERSGEVGEFSNGWQPGKRKFTIRGGGK